MPDFTDLSQAVSTLKGLHDGTIDPNTLELPEELQDIQTENVEDSSLKEEEQTEETKETEEEKTTEETEEETDETDKEESTEEQPEKKVQTPEENRKFAEQRRQQELERRVQEELNKRLQESPEMQLAKTMAEQFGVTPQEMLKQIQLGQLQEQNPDVPVEQLQQQMEKDQQTTQMQEQLAEAQFKLWQLEVKQEASQLQKQFPVLTDDDLQATMDYMLGTLGTTNIPLKQAVMAVHGEKILEYQTTQARNEILAEKSGRKSSIAPQGVKSSPAPTLSADEKQIAKLMGISEEDYLKYK
jgi:hypothetical protein